VKTRPVRKRKENDSVNTADSKLQITKKKYCGTVLEGFWDLEKDCEKKSEHTRGEDKPNACPEQQGWKREPGQRLCCRLEKQIEVLLCVCEDRCFYNCGSALRAAWDAASAGREGAAGTNLGLWISACGTKCLVVVSTCSFADGFGQRRVTYQEALLCLRCGFMVFCLVLVSS
jgi:hypothetical protein